MSSNISSVKPESAKLILATKNAHKLQELREILAPLVPGFTPDMVISARDLALPEVVEDGTSFTANALLKAQAIYEATGISAVADDSGLCVDIMGGAPGIFSARWSGSHGDDNANLQLLLAQMRDIKAENRQARFLCAAAVVGPKGLKRHTLGEMPGRIAFSPQGENGFGYDPIFIPEGYECTNAQLEPAEKNRISHRAKAFKELSPVLAALLGMDGDPDRVTA